MSMLFAKTLRKLRCEGGRSQRDLARWMSLTRLSVERREIGSWTNVVFPTAYAQYSWDARHTGASGSMFTPLTVAGVREQLGYLRYPLLAGGEGL